MSTSINNKSIFKTTNSTKNDKVRYMLEIPIILGILALIVLISLIGICWFRFFRKRKSEYEINHETNDIIINKPELFPNPLYNENNVNNENNENVNINYETVL